LLLPSGKIFSREGGDGKEEVPVLIVLASTLFSSIVDKG
jgi:hypothetical protein